jgi:hypothetical protein
LEIVGIDTISCLIAVLKTAAMDKDYERFTVPVGRNIKVQLLLGAAACNIGNVHNPGNTLSYGRIGRLRLGSRLCVRGWSKT